MTIISCEYGTRTVQDRFGNRTVVPGEYIRTADGDVWFHPYGGQAPMRVAHA